MSLDETIANLSQRPRFDVERSGFKVADADGMKSIIFAVEVFDELQEAIDYYADRSNVQHQRFLLALQRTINQIREQPQLFGRIYRTFRAAPVRRYPFLVIYKSRRHRIEVYTVHHVKSGSFRWLKRTI
jgi:plasmid stabilization system protein ParE